jgi:EmrB/QacA subfamily drug resistance transporter
MGQKSVERAVLLLTTIGTLMVAVDSTIVILALPTMGRDLASPLSTIIWTILIYLLIVAALTTQSGRIGDLFGRGRVYNLGFAIFTIGSALSGFAPSDTVLIVARGIQAVGGALVFANGGALIAAVFPPERRGRAFGYLVLGWGVGAILGILLGGVITTTLGWRYIFFINIPIGIFAAYLGLTSLPKDEPQRGGFDVPGLVLFSAILTLVSYGLIEIAVYGPSILNLGYLALGGVLVVPFVFVELRGRNPMLDVRQLNNRLLSFSLVAGFFQSLGYLSVIFLLTMYLQGLRGLSPLDASLLLVPGYLVGSALGPWVGRRVDREGARFYATLGILFMAAAVLAYSQLGVSTWLGWVPVISLVSGFGIGTFYPANNTAIMSQASPRTFGAISGLRSTLMNLGTLLSFVLALTIASASIPRYVAYQVFLGTTNLVGGLSTDFLGGIHAALYGSAAILALAAVLSWSRGREVTASPAGAASPMRPPGGSESAPLADAK